MVRILIQPGGINKHMGKDLTIIGNQVALERGFGPMPKTRAEAPS